MGDDNGNAEPEEVKDASGNTIKVQAQKSQSDKEKKAELKKIDKKLKDHAKKKDLTDEEYWELMDRKEELKNELAKWASATLRKSCQSACPVDFYASGLH